MSEAIWVRLLSSPVWGDLVWALLHTVWIGGLGGICVAAVLWALPASRARLRHGVCLAGLVWTLVGGILAWGFVERIPEGGMEPISAGIHSTHGERMDVERIDGGLTHGGLTDAERVPFAAAAAGEEGIRGVAESGIGVGGGSSVAVGRGIDAVAWVAVMWLAGVILMGVRMLRAVSGAGRLRRLGRPVPGAEALQRVLDELQAMGGRAGRVGVLAVDGLLGPAVVGVLRPVILWPASWATGLPEWQVRAILAHELAHIVRHDYLVNLLQMAVEALLFFNPAVWWMSRQARIEREACCDALAARLLGEAGEWDLARALAAVAGGASGVVSARAPVGAMAFGGSPRRGLLERVRRLLEPENRPTLRLTWPALAGLTGLMLIALAGLKWAGDAVADSLMSHQERIARMESLKELAPDFGREGRRDYGEEDRITVRGTIRAAFGARLPDRLQMSMHSERPRHGYRSGHTLPGAPGSALSEDGTEMTFEIPIEYGEIHLAVMGEGFAPAFAGPLTAAPGGIVEDVDLLMMPGIEAQIRVTDERGGPLPGVELLARTLDPAQGWRETLTTDEGGIATIEHAPAIPMKLEARHAGYMEAVAEEFIASAEEPFVWALQPARPTVGRVVDAETGRPLAGVELRQQERRGGPLGQMSWGSDNGPVLATTGEDGEFTIDTFSDGTEYFVLAATPDRSHIGFFRLLPGETGKTLEMDRTLTVAGTIRNADQLTRDRAGNFRSLRWSLRRSFGDEQLSLDGDVEIEDLGTTANFRIVGVLPGRLSIVGHGLHENLTVTESVADLVLNREGIPMDLEALQAQLDEAHPMRDVVVTVSPPRGAPPPSGEVTAEYWRFIVSPGSEEGFYRQTERIRIPLGEDGTARFAVPTPNRVELSPQGLNGYWFPTFRSADQGSPKPGGDVEADEMPYEIGLALRPAGGIDGRLFDSEGRPATGLLISLVASDLPDGLPGNSLGIEIKTSSKGREDSSRFFAGPLPLGGTYRIVAYQGWNYQVSDLIRLTEKQPFIETSLTMPEPIDLTGRITDPDGNPIPGVKVELSFSVPGHGYGRDTAPVTGPDGTFMFRGLNPNPPEGSSYSITLLPEADFVPMSTQLESDNNTPLHLTLQRGRTVEGIAVNAGTGLPLRGLEIYAQGAWHEWYKERPTHIDADAVTDENGRFQFTRLRPNRPYTLTTRGGQLRQGGDLPAEDAGDIRLEITPQDWWLARNPQ